MTYEAKTTLCWSCKNAVPDKRFGCSWSERLVPVYGSVMKPGTYCVISCPEYIADNIEKQQKELRGYMNFAGGVTEMQKYDPQMKIKVVFEDESDLISYEWNKYFGG